MPRKELPIELPCSGGCGKTVRLRPSKIRKADYYVCNADCEKKLPEPAPGLIKDVQFDAAGGFRGISHITAEQARQRREEAACAYAEDVDEEAYDFEKIACPFCQTMLNWTKHDCCPSCGALFDFDRIHLMNRFLSHKPQVKLSALVATIDTCFAETSDPPLEWVRITNSDEGDLLESACKQISGPASCDEPVTIDVPFLIDEFIEAPERQRLLEADEITKENLATTEDNLIQLPTCTYCIHALSIKDQRRDWVSTETLHYCVNPLTGDDLSQHFSHSYVLMGEPGLYGDSRTQDKFENDILEAFLERRLYQVEDAPLSGFASGSVQSRHGPICPAFEVDRNHSDICAGPHFAAKATVPIQFFPKGTKPK